MAVERIEPGAPTAPVSTNFGPPPDQYFQDAGGIVTPEPVPLAPEQATPPAPSPAPTPAAPAPVADPQGEGWLAQQTPEVQSYVTKLRQESAGYRQRAGAAEGLFQGWQDEDRSVLEEAIRLSTSNPGEAAALWEQIAGIFGEYAPAEPAPAGAPAVQQGLTAQDVQRMLDERDQRAQAAQSEQAIQTTAAGFGYQPNTPDYVAFLHIAVNETGGDLEAAHTRMQERQRAAVDAYLEQQRAAAGGLPTPTPTGHGPMPQGQPITDFKQARAGADAYLDQVLGPQRR